MSDTHIQIDAHELLEGWKSGKYKAGYVLDLLSKIDGTGSFSQRVQYNLNLKSLPNGSTSTNPNGNKTHNEIGGCKELIEDWIKEADEVLANTIDGTVTTDKIAEIYTSTNWDGSDPYKKIKRLEPENVLDFLNDRKIRGEYYEQLSESAQYLLRVLIPNAWRAWMRKTENIRHLDNNEKRR